MCYHRCAHAPRTRESLRFCASAACMPPGMLTEAYSPKITAGDGCDLLHSMDVVNFLGCGAAAGDSRNIRKENTEMSHFVQLLDAQIDMVSGGNKRHPEHVAVAVQVIDQTAVAVGPNATAVNAIGTANNTAN